ncbi:MAG: single-stranded-DNA-specific exonuclease RecJ [Clostridia bacterium]|nr:single-stranded-DNA-specific exonuclease RecJ [Clostridia bacterium]
MVDSVWIENLQCNVSLGLPDAIKCARPWVDEPGFANPSIEFLNDPFLFNDMGKAVALITDAIENNHRICIYGDYDADGLTSSAMMLDFLKRHGALADKIIPNRFDDGYGLNMESAIQIVESGVSLVITTDCGISAIDEIKYLKQNNVKVLVSDHHQAPFELPEADAIVCCSRPDNKYPFAHLSGAGVVFKILQALCETWGKGGEYLEYLPLAALGTVADIVPLTGENRVIVKNGLDSIGRGGNAGIRALLENAGSANGKVSSYALGFIVGPRINAAGRMGDPLKAFDILTEKDYAKALGMAAFLSALNNRRRDEQNKVVNIIKEIMENDEDLMNSPVIVAGKHDISKGVIGIAASKICEEYNKPAIIFSINDGIATGSGRSSGDFSLIESLRHCECLLMKYGGHKMAAGVELDESRIGELRECLAGYALSNKIETGGKPSIYIDAIVRPFDITRDNCSFLNSLEPYGKGNEKPLLSMHGVLLTEPRVIGKDMKHMSFKINKGSICIKGIFFNSTEYFDMIRGNEKFDIAFHLELNEYMGRKSL